MAHAIPDHESPQWLQARQRVANRRDLASHLVAYAVVNAAFVTDADVQAELARQSRRSAS